MLIKCPLGDILTIVSLTLTLSGDKKKWQMRSLFINHIFDEKIIFIIVHLDLDDAFKNCSCHMIFSFFFSKYNCSWLLLFTAVKIFNWISIESESWFYHCLWIHIFACHSFPPRLNYSLHSACYLLQLVKLCLKFLVSTTRLQYCGPVAHINGKRVKNTNFWQVSK